MPKVSGHGELDCAGEEGSGRFSSDSLFPGLIASAEVLRRATASCRQSVSVARYNVVLRLARAVSKPPIMGPLRADLSDKVRLASSAENQILHC